MWIKGSDHPRLEPVEPEIINIRLGGPSDTEDAVIIRQKLEILRDFEVGFNSI
jgi:hypothetical protein